MKGRREFGWAYKRDGLWTSEQKKRGDQPEPQYQVTQSSKFDIMKFLSALLPFAPLVAAHGYVDKGVIGGQTIQFYQVPFLSSILTSLR